jgi:hypothetical protein
MPVACGVCFDLGNVVSTPLGIQGSACPACGGVGDAEKARMALAAREKQMRAQPPPVGAFERVNPGDIPRRLVAR